MGRDRNRKNLRLEVENNPKIHGLHRFVTYLEKEYFSKISVRDCTAQSEDANLVIELNCPMKLMDLFRQLYLGTWGLIIHEEETGAMVSPLQKAFSDLASCNQTEIEIEELSINLQDCSIVIRKIYDQSIAEQLLDIFNSFTEHLIYLTSKFREIPYEIYVPVFEGDMTDCILKIADIEQNRNQKKDYFGHWGLYFESMEDAVIYELPSKRVVSGELYMLDH